MYTRRIFWSYWHQKKVDGTFRQLGGASCSKAWSHRGLEPCWHVLKDPHSRAQAVQEISGLSSHKWLSTHAGFLSAPECIPLKIKDYSFPYTPLKPDSGITFIEFVGFASLWRGFETWLTFWAHWSCITMHERQMKDKDFKGERGRMAESSVLMVSSHTVWLWQWSRAYPAFIRAAHAAEEMGKPTVLCPEISP